MRWRIPKWPDFWWDLAAGIALTGAIWYGIVKYWG